MARVVEELPAGGQVRPELHPWRDWFDGRVWLLEAGVDFSIDPESMRRQVGPAARRHGVTATTRVRPEGIYIQAVKR